MKLLRSTFLAFYIASNSNVSAFAPQIPSGKSLSTQQYTSVGRAASSQLFVGLHEQPQYQISDEELRRESMFRQVLKEVESVKEYLNFIIEESGGASSTESEEGGDAPTFGDVLAEKAAAGEVELFGGGGIDSPSSEAAKETQYKPALRSDLGSSVLLSGAVDSTLLNVLNNNFFGQDLVPNFQFKVIKALVEDVQAAKKKAISREARYGGLLDKLVIEPASTPSSTLPTKEELSGMSSWIVQVDGADGAASTLAQVAELAKGSEALKNVVVMATGASSGSVEGWDAVVEASNGGEAFKCTLLAVGELYDGGKDGGYYHVGPLDAAAGSPSRLPRKKAYQLLAHALALDSTADATLAAYEYPADMLETLSSPFAEGEFAVRDDDGNEMADEKKDDKMYCRMIRAMREVGFTQVMELDVLVSKGLSVSALDSGI